jgi:glutamate formiminotransferase/formiminotetrahydrofolate cyclodeaminase
VGLVPLKVLLDAGRYFLKKQQRSTGVSESELIKIAVKSMGLDELAPFDPQQKIIEYNLAKDDPAAANKLIRKDLRAFADEAASESVAPGGGSVSAYAGALGVSMATMVANISSHKRGWDERWEEFSDAAEQGQRLKDALLHAVDEDTEAFNAIMAAFGLPKGSKEEVSARLAAIEQATVIATEVPLRVVRLGLECFPLIRQMVRTGNPNSITDAGVGALCVRTAVLGAALNVKVNAKDLNDKAYAKKVIAEADAAMAKATTLEAEILALVRATMGV